MIKKLIIASFLILFIGNVCAEAKVYKMVFVPASEKGDESDYKSLILITEKLTGLNIDTIKVTDYNAAVEAMRAGRAHIAWYGGKTYVKAAEIANAEAFAAGVRPGEKDAGYFTYFVVKKDSNLKEFKDVRGKVLSLNTIGSTSGIKHAFMPIAVRVVNEEEYQEWLSEARVKFAKEEIKNDKLKVASK